MRLKRFKVTSFRSVDDSGWIQADDVTALIGTNESGKTNLLLPLWKLNPAKDGEIHPTADFPRKHFTAIRSTPRKPVFIEAAFETPEDLCKKLEVLTGIPSDNFREVIVSRRLDGEREIKFPGVPDVLTVSSSFVSTPLQSAREEIASLEPMKTEQDLKARLLQAIASAEDDLSGLTEYRLEDIRESCSALSSLSLEVAPKSSSIAPRFQRLLDELKDLQEQLSKPHPHDADTVKELVLERLPQFVYYSNYGNLDSEIYLPHVIQNLNRADLGQKETAKARTLKVLFEFVDLEPKEILDLGKDLHAAGEQPTGAQLEISAENKKERSILLQSASSRLTNEFRQWWKQGDYRFRFEADGDHFRIWVSDDRRPEEVELEGRSTGLQWFLSFYLVFLVESEDTHVDCILLLDEPGISLHPLAQRDLSDFFDGLAVNNQLLYTTHSPFLVDADRLDRARKVYIASDGTSKATPDLGADGGDVTKRGAGYAVHAALGLSVAESLLIGCEPVIVEGPSDQHYLTAIKTLLIASGSLKPGKELVFPPAGGAKGVRAVSSILGSRDEALPMVLLDSDHLGTKYAQGLRTSLYESFPNRVLQVGSYVEVANAEIEDLIPQEVISKAVDRLIRDPDTPFADHVRAGSSIVPQVEAWASRFGVTLEKSWKVELAKSVKQSLLARGTTPLPPATLDIWNRLFTDFQAASTPQVGHP